MIKQYFVSLFSFLIIDGIWLTVVAKNFYAKHLGYLMAKTPNLLAAGIFYLIYISSFSSFSISSKRIFNFSYFNGSFIWFLCLCYLRFNQSSHHQRLALSCYHCRFNLGSSFIWISRWH